MMDKGLRRVVFGGLFTALITVATLFLKIPTAIGYANLGDGFVLAGAFLLGPYAAIPAALGSGLSDLLLGYAAYIPATVVIKGGMGLLAGLLVREQKGLFSLRNLLVFLAAEALMVGGYFLFETLLYGAGAAVGSLLPNAVQGACGIVLALAIAPVIAKLKIER